MNLLIQGMRPKTLIAAIIPPVVASGIYFLNHNEHQMSVMTLCLLLALFIQIATNFYNDAIDFKKGADADRVGPKRVTNHENVNLVFKLGHIFILLAFLAGLPLMIKGGWPIITLGLVSLFFAYGYTGGPYPLAYLGLGELFVFLFFGWVATIGSYYLMSQQIDLNIFLIASAIGLLSCTLIAINNLRDKEKDSLVSKNTLATKMSDAGYLKLMDFFIFGPYFILLYFIIFVNLKFAIVLLSIKFAHLTRSLIHNHTVPAELNSALALSGKHLFVFGLLFWFVCLWI